MRLGIYQFRDLLDETALNSLEEEYGAAISILSFYRAWNHCSIEDDLSWLHAVLSSSKDILLTWEPWLLPADPNTPENQPAFSYKSIFSGLYDTYIKAFASALALSNRTIYLRPMHEMNGCWYPWCGTSNHNSPDEYVIAWKHLRSIFKEEGAENIKWVWSPYASSYPDTSINALSSYFPGDDEIDMVALDGYNWGTSTEWGEWQRFSSIFKQGYDTVTSLSSKPVIIAETGCTEVGGSKAEWINEMFYVLPSQFEQVEAMVWFDIHKECDWRINSSLESLNAFRKYAPAASK